MKVELTKKSFPFSAARPPKRLPKQLFPEGLSIKRQWYLYDQIRSHIPCEEDKDKTCPIPKAPRLSSKIRKMSFTLSSLLPFTTPYVFSDPFALNKYDDEHSENEDRWILLGKSLSEVVLVVVHTFRDDDGKESVRIISARRATKGEKQAYHERCPK